MSKPIISNEEFLDHAGLYLGHLDYVKKCRNKLDKLEGAKRDLAEAENCMREKEKHLKEAVGNNKRIRVAVVGTMSVVVHHDRVDVCEINISSDDSALRPN